MRKLVAYKKGRMEQEVWNPERKPCTKGQPHLAGRLIRSTGVDGAPTLSKALFWAQKTRNTRDKNPCLYEPQALTASCFCRVNSSVEQTLPFNLEALGQHFLCMLSKKRHLLGLPWWLSGKESAYQCSRHGFDPRSRKIPHAEEQLSLWATEQPSLCSGARTEQRQKGPHSGEDSAQPKIKTKGCKEAHFIRTSWGNNTSVITVTKRCMYTQALVRDHSKGSYAGPLNLC